MEAVTILTYRTDLAKGVKMCAMEALLATGDTKAHRICIEVLRNGQQVSLDGLTVSGGFVRADDYMVPLVGRVHDGKAEVVLPQACYRIGGAFALAVRLVQGDEISTIFWGRGVVTQVDTDAVIDLDQRIPSLQELLDRIERMEQGTAAANAAAGSAEAAGTSAETAARRANTAAEEAEEQAAGAKKAAGEADAARQAASKATDDALGAADKANSAAGRVDAGVAAAEAALEEAHTAVNRADKAVDLAQGAIEEAAGAADEAHAAGAAANDAAARAMKAASVAEKWGSVTATVEMLDPEADPVITVTDTETGKSLEFRLPRGLTGLTPDITIGEVITGDPDSHVQVWFTGTAEKRVLNLSIPRGAVGEVQNLTICGKSPDAGGELTLTAEDIGARPDDWTPTAEDIGALPADGTAAAAEKLAAAIAIALTGDVTGSANFDGSQAVSVAAVLASIISAGNVGPTGNSSPGFGAGIIVPYLAYDAKGRITGVANRTITLPAAPSSVSGSAGNVSMPTYASFAAAWAAKAGYTFRAYVVNYTGSDTAAPSTADGDNWWNVIEFGITTRCVQIASHAFKNRNILYLRVRHDSTWYGWYTLTGSTASTTSAADAGAVAFARLAEMGAIDAVTAGEHAEVFDEWAVGVSYAVGQIRRYGDKLYRCQQAHASQSDWMPDITPALWELIADPEA